MCGLLLHDETVLWVSSKDLSPGKSASSLALVRTKYNVVVFFGAVCFHTALFASEPETRVLRSSIHCFIHSTIPELIWNRTETTSSAGSRCGCLVLTRVWLLYFHLPKRSAPKRETNLSSIQSNQTRQVWMHPYIEKTKTEVIFTFNISL